MICRLGQTQCVHVFLKKPAKMGNTELLVWVIVRQKSDTVGSCGDLVYRCSKHLQVLLPGIRSCVCKVLQLE